MKLIFVNILFIVICFYNVCSGQSNFSNSTKLALAEPNLYCQHDNKVYGMAMINSNFKLNQIEIQGFELISQIDSIITFSVPISHITRLIDHSMLKYIELSNKMNSLRKQNDEENKFTKVDKLHDGINNALPQNYTGANTIVGIVDVGFQNNHPNFYNQNGTKNRIVRYWHQNYQQGTPPQGYTYGTEFTTSTGIDSMNDYDGIHGTHVAGIAAGSGLSSPNFKYKGVAPDADLVFVTIKYSNDSIPGSALGDYVVANSNIIDAYKYIFDYAESVGKPAVINLSWGMHTGSHDGNSLFDKAVESLVGKGKVLVGANGNDGDNPMHWNYNLRNDTASTIMIENNRQDRADESVYSDFWGNENTDFKIEIEIIDTNLISIFKTGFVSSTLNKTQTYNTTYQSENVKITMASTQKNPLNNKPNITVMVEHSNSKRFFILAHLASVNSDIHAWNSGGVKRWTSGAFRKRVGVADFSSTYITGNTEYTVGENGGTSKSMISVGALAARSSFYNYKGQLINDSSYVLPGGIARFSSKGPTVDGRIKPNISAPGYDVPSSVNNKQIAPWMLNRTVLKSEFKNDTNYWMTSNGTSMAAPQVTGIVALLLQANPNLTALQVKDILETTATVDAQTGVTPNNVYGHGKVNAYNAILKAIQMSNISENEIQLFNVYPNPSNHKCYIEFQKSIENGTIEITTIQGQSIDLFHFEHQTRLEIDLSNYNVGVYFLNVKILENEYTIKVVKY